MIAMHAAGDADAVSVEARIEECQAGLTRGSARDDDDGRRGSSRRSGRHGDGRRGGGQGWGALQRRNISVPDKIPKNGYCHLNSTIFCLPVTAIELHTSHSFGNECNAVGTTSRTSCCAGAFDGAATGEMVLLASGFFVGFLAGFFFVGFFLVGFLWGLGFGQVVICAAAGDQQLWTRFKRLYAPRGDVLRPRDGPRLGTALQRRAEGAVAGCTRTCAALGSCKATTALRQSCGTTGVAAATGAQAQDSQLRNCSRKTARRTL